MMLWVALLMIIACSLRTHIKHWTIHNGHFFFVEKQFTMAIATRKPLFACSIVTLELDNVEGQFFAMAHSEA